MSDAFRARLRRLRRDAPEAESQPAPAREGLPAWLGRRIGQATPGSADRGGETTPPADLRDLEGGGAERVTLLPCEHQHGSWGLGTALDSSAAALARIGRDDALRTLDPGAAVYLDIETTGLSGGAGTWPFLVALGRFTREGEGEPCFELWQGFMRGPEDEASVMAETARRVAAAGQLVTFFGKSFDRHRLEDKMRLHGIDPPFAGAPHLDLYHACRRLYGGAYADGRLQTMERALCAVERQDDLPGSMAPAAWYDFLAGRPHRLEEVFQHNLDDVLSLVTLTAHVARSFEERDPRGRALSGSSAHRALGLAKLEAEARDHRAAAHWLERALERVETEEARRAVAFDLGRCRERAGEGESALEGYVVLAEGNDPAAARAAARAALVLERRRRHEEALTFTTRASALVQRTLCGSEAARMLRELDSRRQRLERKGRHERPGAES
ncbi:MAG: ribonuclease H-like domain-containing protein [Planctomycetota bacterium]